VEHAPEKESYKFHYKGKYKDSNRWCLQEKEENFPDVGDTIELIRIYPHWFNFSIKIKNNHSANWNRMQ